MGGETEEKDADEPVEIGYCNTTPSSGYCPQLKFFYRELKGFGMSAFLLVFGLVAFVVGTTTTVIGIFKGGE